MTMIEKSLIFLVDQKIFYKFSSQTFHSGPERKIKWEMDFTENDKGLEIWCI